MRDYIDRRVVSPTWGLPPPCKRTVKKPKKLILSSKAQAAGNKAK